MNMITFLLVLLPIFVFVVSATPGIRGTNNGLLVEGPGMSVQGSFNVTGEFSTALMKSVDIRASGISAGRPSDFWADIDTDYFSVNGDGALASNGGYEVTLTSNGYRRAGNVWQSFSAGTWGGAAEVALHPSGKISLRTEAEKSDGTDYRITERVVVDDTGLSVSGDLSVAGKLEVTGNEGQPIDVGEHISSTRSPVVLGDREVSTYLVAMGNFSLPNGRSLLISNLRIGNVGSGGLIHVDLSLFRMNETAPLCHMVRTTSASKWRNVGCVQDSGRLWLGTSDPTSEYVWNSPVWGDSNSGIAIHFNLNHELKPQINNPNNAQMDCCNDVNLRLFGSIRVMHGEYEVN